MKEMQQRQEELESNNKRLQKEEQDLREKFNEVCTSCRHLLDQLLLGNQAAKCNFINNLQTSTDWEQFLYIIPDRLKQS